MGFWLSCSQGKIHLWYFTDLGWFSVYLDHTVVRKLVEIRLSLPRVSQEGWKHPRLSVFFSLGMSFLFYTIWIDIKHILESNSSVIEFRSILNAALFMKNWNFYLVFLKRVSMPLEFSYFKTNESCCQRNW